MSIGGMLSFYFVVVIVLLIGVVLEQGLDFFLFVVVVIFVVIMMFDVIGVRWYVGEQVMVINKLVIDFNWFVSEVKDFLKVEEKEKQKKLKELFGYQLIEVFFGGVIGIVLILILDYFFM